MKKLFAILMALTLTLSMAACGTKDTAEPEKTETTKATNPKTPTIITKATEVPTEVPTEAPTEVPTEAPTEAPTEEPVVTTKATKAPTTVATKAPTTVATKAPTTVATKAPTTVATKAPTTVATKAPTTVATKAPTTATKAPTTTTKAPTTAATQPAKNEFNKPWNQSYIANNSWSIYLGHAHWEGNRLAIKFFITNGHNRDITLNLTKTIEIKDSKGTVIARTDLTFTNYVVKYQEYNTVSITLDADATLKPGANLNDSGLDIWMLN